MMDTLRYTILDSPVGPLRLSRDAHGLCALQFVNGRKPIEAPPDVGIRADDAFGDIAAELDEYFAGRLQAFTVPFACRGTLFQRRVWDALCRIPYGETISYAELARRIGQPRAVRAVGLANGANPIAILVPCHRVIGANGTLTGYGGGLPTKRFLLDLERSGSDGGQTGVKPGSDRGQTAFSY
jgi:methylated-DNA-[protein]-cysteine S-methyltransferase